MKKILAIIMGVIALAACSAPTQNSDTTKKSNLIEEHTQVLLNQGISAYESQNYDDAMAMFTQASAAGEIQALRYIGLMYLNGYGVEKNPTRAVVEFTKSANEGDMAGQYWLAYCYEWGMGVPQNIETAMRLYTISASGGNKRYAPAMTALGRLTEPDSQREAVEWYQKAAALGDMEAQSRLNRLGIKNKD